MAREQLWNTVRHQDVASAFVTAVTIDTELCCYGANKLYYVCRMHVGHIQWLWKWAVDTLVWASSSPVHLLHCLNPSHRK